MRLCLFTNCHDGCLTSPTIFMTIKSWIDTFGEPSSMQIYCDPSPNKTLYRGYASLIKSRTGIEPIKTYGLADGWKLAIDNAPTPYLFMCEADWVFNETIKHTLGDIEYIMKQDNLWFMLFNQHINDKSLNGTKWQTYFNPTDEFYCKSDRFSNNPNIINVKYFKNNIMHRIDWTIGEAGRIEQVLQRTVDIAVYGEYNLPPTIKHLNMRNRRPKTIY